MSEFFAALEPAHQDLLLSSPIFFVATAAADGRVNVSPKGLDTLRVLAPDRVAYLDLTGSGNESAAHILQCNRITLMVCSFTRNAMILRLYGSARSVQPGDAEWAELADRFTLLPGTRQIFVIDIESVQTSCGYAVPQMELVAPRQALVKWAEGKSDDELEAYRARKNVASIDGYPTGLQTRSNQ